MGTILAHGTGPGHDLPIPLFYAAISGQVPLMVLMVVVTTGGLTLLAVG